MPADFEIGQGDTAPILQEQLKLANGKLPNLTGSEVSLVMRNSASAEPVKLTGTLTVINAVEAKVSYHFSQADTEAIGQYLASWNVVFPTGDKMRFPTSGYLWINVEPSLLATGGILQMVPLPEVKEYLGLPALDRAHDAKLLRYISAVRPIIENLTGPILPQVFEEWHDGGNYSITLRRRPSTAYGTEPVLELMACSEYLGTQEYPLEIVANPGLGTIYSCMLNAREGKVVRRTSGGGIQAFAPAPDSVHVVYRAGQSIIPPNVVEATLETIRVNYMTTQQVGRGRETVADSDEYRGPSMGFFLPRRVRELLGPHRRAPSIF